MARMLLLSAMTDSTHDPHNPFGGLDLLSSSVVLLDEDLRIRYMNSAAENLLALSSKAVRGMRFDSVVSTSSPAGWPHPPTPR